MRKGLEKFAYMLAVILAFCSTKLTVLAEEAQAVNENTNGNTVQIHWIILALTVLFTVYQLVRCISRNREIEKIEDEMMKQAEYQS